MAMTPAEKQRRYRDKKRDSGEGDNQGMKCLNLFIPLRAYTALKYLGRHTGKTTAEILNDLIMAQDARVTTGMTDTEFDMYLRQ